MRYRLLVMMLLLVAGACRSESEFTEESRTAVLGVQPLPGLPVQVLDTANPAASQQPGAQNGVTLTEWLVEPEYGAMPAGVIRLRVRNRGTQPHALRIEGAGVDQQSEPIRPGSEVFMTLVLEQGQYTLSCPLRDAAGTHREHGMQRMVRVQ